VGQQKVDAYAAVLDTDWWCLTFDDFRRITGDITKPTWYSSWPACLEGQIPTLGSTALGDQLVFAYQVGEPRRKSHAGALPPFRRVEPPASAYAWREVPPSF
jgi:hypothetical protein